MRKRTNGSERESRSESGSPDRSQAGRRNLRVRASDLHSEGDEPQSPPPTVRRRQPKRSSSDLWKKVKENLPRRKTESRLRDRDSLPSTSKEARRKADKAKQDGRKADARKGNGVQTRRSKSALDLSEDGAEKDTGHHLSVDTNPWGAEGASESSGFSESAHSSYRNIPSLATEVDSSYYVTDQESPDLRQNLEHGRSRSRSVDEPYPHQALYALHGDPFSIPLHRPQTISHLPLVQYHPQHVQQLSTPIQHPQLLSPYPPIGQYISQTPITQQMQPSSSGFSAQFVPTAQQQQIPFMPLAALGSLYPSSTFRPSRATGARPKEPKSGQPPGHTSHKQTSGSTKHEENRRKYVQEDSDEDNDSPERAAKYKVRPLPDSEQQQKPPETVDDFEQQAIWDPNNEDSEEKARILRILGIEPKLPRKKSSKPITQIVPWPKRSLIRKETVKEAPKPKPIWILTNYVNINTSALRSKAYHYSVGIVPNSNPGVFRALVEEIRSRKFPSIKVAYNGLQNLYSPKPLPDDAIDQPIELSVDVPHGSGTYSITLTRTVNPVDLRQLKTYESTRTYHNPYEALQCIGTILNEPCHKKGTYIAGSFFTVSQKHIGIDDKFELREALYQSPTACEQLFLNIDISRKVFLQHMSLPTFYQILQTNRYSLKDSMKTTYLQCPAASPSTASNFYRYVKAVNPKSPPPYRSISNDYTPGNMLLPKIVLERGMEKFCEKMENLVIPWEQKVSHKHSGIQSRNINRYLNQNNTLIKRKDNIFTLFRFMHHNNDPVMKSFGLSISEYLLPLELVQIPQPVIEYKNYVTITPDPPGVWCNYGKKFIMSDLVFDWCIANLSGVDTLSNEYLNDVFIKRLIAKSKEVGMKLNDKCDNIYVPHFANIEDINIAPYLQKMINKGIRLVIVIIPKNPIAYSLVKKQAELQCGIVTQCLRSHTVLGKLNKVGDSLLNSILMKINVKLSGINHKVSPYGISLQFVRSFMFFGAGISFISGFGDFKYSIVGVAGSQDDRGYVYNMQAYLQEHNDRHIEKLKEIFSRQLLIFQQSTFRWPAYIFYYRNNLAGYEEKPVLYKELQSMKAVCANYKITPLFTCISVSRNHRTYWFRKAEQLIPAGSLVDQEITLPTSTQFFLVSNHVDKTSRENDKCPVKPTKYNIIINESRLCDEDLHLLTYKLCNSYQLCTRSISCPAPIYYADSIRKRAKAYFKECPKEIILNQLGRRFIVSKNLERYPMFFV